jgi:hypothetical protein
MDSTGKNLIARYSFPNGVHSFIRIPDINRIDLFNGNNYSIDFFESYSKNQEYYERECKSVIGKWYLRYWHYLENRCK